MKILTVQAAAAEAAKEVEEKELEKLLAAVADEHKNIIMTSVNEAWAAPGSLLDLFLEGFRAGEGIARFVDHLLIVALDDGAFRRCRDVHPHCYRLAVAGRNFTDEKVFMSEDYLDLVWSKVKLQQRILELGYNFLFTVRYYNTLRSSWNSTTTSYKFTKGQNKNSYY